MSRAAAYCRVSTTAAAQLDSYEAQRAFFVLYCQRHGHELVAIYGDEGKSGVKMKTRPQLMQLLADAQAHRFDLVLVKDVSRLARNVMDFLSAVRALKALGIDLVFVNADLSSSDGSEFILTILSAIAQEESAGLSRRIKFGKRLSGEQGRVPNLVYGYRRLGRFQLEVVPQEAAVVTEIFLAYARQGHSLARIAEALNRRGLCTRRGCAFSPKAIQRILHNPLYTGRVVCSKSEVADFLTGRRQALPPERQQVTLRPELRIVPDALFLQATEKARSKQHRARQGAGEPR